MKNYLPIIACAVAGVIIGYGLTATITNAQLNAVAESAQALDLSPISAPTQNFNQGGGSCG